MRLLSSKRSPEFQKLVRVPMFGHDVCQDSWSRLLALSMIIHPTELEMTRSSLVSPDLPSSLLFDAPLKLGVLASGSGSNFAAVAEAIAAGTLQAQIQVLIYNNPGAKVVERAEQWQVPAILLNHREFAEREALDRQIVQVLKDHDVEWVIMAGWMRRVTAVLIEAFRDRILNIHPSLLPSFPGIRAVEQALNHGVKITGCTVHRVELMVDSGPIIQQAAVPVLPDDTPETLHARIQQQEHRIFPQAIALAAWQSCSQKELV